MLYCENTNQTLLIMPNIKKYLEHQMVRKNVNLKAEMPSLYAAFCFRELIVCFGEHVPQIWCKRWRTTRFTSFERADKIIFEIVSKFTYFVIVNISIFIFQNR